MAGSTGL